MGCESIDGAKRILTSEIGVVLRAVSAQIAGECCSEFRDDQERAEDGDACDDHTQTRFDNTPHVGVG